MTSARNEILSASVNIDGAEIYYESFGAGPALVLIHAGIADCRMWDDQFGAFASQFQTTRYDMRGVGRSGKAAAPFSHHDDLKQLLEARNIERAHLVALSFGARVALDFAVSYPEMMHRLVLCSVLGPPPFSHSLTSGWEAAERALESGGLAAVNEVEMQIWVDGPGRTPKDVKPMVRQRVADMNLDALRREEESELAPQQLDPPATERLREIAAPTLVIAGTGDQPDVLTYADTLVSEIADARLELIPNAAHMVNMEAPQHFTDLVLRFLSET